MEINALSRSGKGLNVQGITDGILVGNQQKTAVSLGKMTDFIKQGDDPTTAWEKASGQYGRVADAVKIIDPRKE